MIKALIIAAHPDDEILGCGATAAKLAQQGHSVFAAILGEGITSRQKTADKKSEKEKLELRMQGQAAAKICGIQNISFFDLPDNRFDSVPLLQIVKIVESLIQEIQPECIFTHHGSDLNIDHCLTFRAVLTASRPMQNNRVKDIYSFEVPSSTEWSFSRITPIFKPNYFVDVSDTIKIKLEAIQTYESELRIFPHPRSIRGIETQATRWGSVCGVNMAEAFELIRSIN